MASSRSTAVAPTEVMASQSAERATPAPSGLPALATAESGSTAAGYLACGRGAGKNGRPKGQELDGGHPAGWRGGGVDTRHAGRCHHVKWRGRGGVPGRGSPPGAPGQRRAPEPRVLGGGESSNPTAASPPPVQVDGGVGVGLPRVECAEAVGWGGRGRVPLGGGARAAAVQPAGYSPGGGGGAGRGGG